MRPIILCSYLFILLFSYSPIYADASQKGWEIAQKMNQADSGWGDEQVEAEMVLRSQNGKEVTRTIRSRRIEMPNDGDRSLVIFDQPRDVKGTSFLTFTHKQGEDDQWLYLPALRRVKRISSSNRSGPFMGSEFAYEDIGSEEIERYRYRFVKESEIEGEPGFVIERFPVDPNSGYTRQIVYVDQAHYRIHKIEFFDRKEKLLKILERENYQQFGNYWRALSWKMENLQTGKSTWISWKNFQFQTGLTSRDFNKTSLKRLR